MAVGKVSLEDCERLTSSLGWMGVLLPSTPPASSMARLETTSLTFMFDCVPEPVCQTTSGKWSSSSPAMIWSQAATIRSRLPSSSTPSSALARAAAFLRIPKARTTSSGMRSPPMRKLLRERSVCAPQ